MRKCTLQFQFPKFIFKLMKLFRFENDFIKTIIWQEKNTVLPLSITQFTEPFLKPQFNVIYLIVA